MSAPKLPYLIDEICAAVEIYFTGRTGGHYLKTAFILCDDYTELTAKLFLLTDDAGWSDKKANDHFKNYHDVLGDVEGVFRSRGAANMTALQSLHTRMKGRRKRRNDFFHSPRLPEQSDFAKRKTLLDSLRLLSRRGFIGPRDLNSLAASFAAFTSCSGQGALPLPGQPIRQTRG